MLSSQVISDLPKNIARGRSFRPADLGRKKHPGQTSLDSISKQFIYNNLQL